MCAGAAGADEGSGLNSGKERSAGGRSTPVQQPHEERAMLPTAAADINRMLNNFIRCSFNDSKKYI